MASTIGMELNGRRLGLIGLGKIGSHRVARVGSAFGMDVVSWSANLTPDRAHANGARWVPPEELLATSDIVSIHPVLGERSRDLIGAPRIAAHAPDRLPHQYLPGSNSRQRRTY